jgi:hypothetical protein
VHSAGVDSEQLLTLLADTTCQLVTDALRDPRRLDAELIDRLDDAMSDVDRQVGSVPFVRLQLLLAPIVEVCVRLQSTEPLQERLAMVRAKTYVLAGGIARLRGFEACAIFTSVPLKGLTIISNAPWQP